MVALEQILNRMHLWPFSKLKNTIEIWKPTEAHTNFKLQLWLKQEITITKYFPGNAGPHFSNHCSTTFLSFFFFFRYIDFNGIMQISIRLLSKELCSED